MKRITVFPGSFDPFTKGHECIIEKALKLFDEVVIAIGQNTSKNYLFDLEHRKNHIKSIFEGNKRVIVQEFSGLTVEFCKSINAEFIVRGLRDSKDFGYERSIAQMNFEISGIESVFFMTDPEFTPINSTIVREIHKSGGSIDLFVTNAEKLVTSI
ncbi:pantetheine-phosphate adenylyltransferase [Brumimicrobium glaciale]|jgi:pantetheine-phosphate adenylyltransferase|uniref:Phosphopantetheine adenylyltransferase n=1 Tax=Brumimicrobium glaciale TaxID=200475 RepID=A0A4Q4KCV3_9FLAO|nr:pantetheine-phosphate adenylyltransferase [Brumimicrobium glaciale]RYM30842.1 pantetheine-phosphate adenylyltransferase [Brumimicrobium glaciale]